MKFLCVSCNEGMKLEATGKPNEGSLQVTFVCPGCRYKIMMMTNPWETQLVQSLGVKVGGRTTPVTPYEQVFGNLSQPQADAHVGSDEHQDGPGCPFAGMLEEKTPTATSGDICWTAEASMRIERIPSFIRPMVQRAIERYAIEQGYSTISDAVMDEARSRLGM